MRPIYFQTYVEFNRETRQFKFFLIGELDGYKYCLTPAKKGGHKGFWSQYAVTDETPARPFLILSGESTFAFDMAIEQLYRFIDSDTYRWQKYFCMGELPTNKSIVRSAAESPRTMPNAEVAE